MDTRVEPSFPSLEENQTDLRADVLDEGRRTRRHLFIAFGLAALVIYGSTFVALNTVFGRPWF